MDNLIMQLKTILDNPAWSFTVLDNTISAYAATIIIFFLLAIFFKIFQVVILSRLNQLAKKTKGGYDDVLLAAIATLKPPFYIFLSLYVSFYFLNITSVTRQLLNVVLVIWAVYQAITALQILINFGVKKALRQEDERDAKTAIQSLGIITKIILWSLGFLLIISNLGFNVSSLVAGLGIGGVAIALAAQNILGDLFSSFAIYFDKPFKVGDFIVVNGKNKGTVERIGIKTTRLRALEGEELIISNRELTSANIQNFKKMEERRVAFSLGVTYNTDNVILKKIPSLIEGVIKDIKNARFDRAHFRSFADSALTFDIVYYITSEDYAKFMDINQELNLKLKEIFEKEKIAFAYPTQTVYFTGDKPKA